MFSPVIRPYRDEEIAAALHKGSATTSSRRAGHDALIGRERPLAQLEKFIDGVAADGGRLVIAGEAGIGKTTLWQEAVEHAARRGYRVLTCAPAELESALAYSALVDLLEDVDERFFAGIPAPQRLALEVALLQADAVGWRTDGRAVYTGLTALLRTLASDTPVVVAVDDAEWLDASSQKALAYAARRLGDVPVGVLVATRVGASNWRGGETTIELGPLSAGSLHRLVKQRTGVSLTRRTVQRLHRQSGGNPLCALELAAALIAAGVEDSSERWPVPSDLRALVAERLALLSAPQRARLLTAAASANPAFGNLDPKTRKQAERARLAAFSDGRVRFAHPLIAAAIYENATADERRQAHEQLAAASHNIEEQAHHRALAVTSPDEVVASLLERAAAAARSRGAPEVAAELEERAVVLTPLSMIDRRWERALQAATYHFNAGNLQHAHQLLDDLLGQPAPTHNRARVLLLLGETCHRQGRSDDAVLFLRHAVELSRGDAGQAIRAELALAFVDFAIGGDYTAPAAAARRALELAQGLGDHALLASALAASVHAEVLLGNGVDEEKLQRALELEEQGQPGPVERRPSLLAGVVYCAAEQYPRAHEILEQLRAQLTVAGQESDLPYVLATLAMVACFSGDLLAAEEHAEAAFELASQIGSSGEAALAAGLRAFVFAQIGRVEPALVSAAEAAGLSCGQRDQGGAFWAAAALGHLELALGDNDAAADAFAGLVDQVERGWVHDPWRRRLLPDAVEALVQLGQLEQAERFTVALEERASALRWPAATVAAARCRALLRAARGEARAALDDIDRTVTEAGEVVEPLQFARALIVKGQLERRRKDKRQAAASLQQAAEICERLGASLWAQRARAELERLGAVHHPDALTATEGQIAQLAATGLSNRAIAAAAFISQKTVEANMTRIYRKLGIHSRVELATWLAERDRGAEASDVDTDVSRLDFAVRA